MQDQQLTSGINFRLEAGGKLGGKITNYIGMPVENVLVRAIPVSGNTNKTERVSTDINGDFLFNSMSVDQYAMSVVPTQGQNLQVVEVSGVDVSTNPLCPSLHVPSQAAR